MLAALAVTVAVALVHGSRPWALPAGTPRAATAPRTWPLLLHMIETGPRSSAATSAAAAAAAAAARRESECPVDIAVTGINSRRIASSIVVRASPAQVWQILTGELQPVRTFTAPRYPSACLSLLTSALARAVSCPHRLRQSGDPRAKSGRVVAAAAPEWWHPAVPGGSAEDCGF